MNRSLIVGLGNPGRKYEQTRHNVGFLTVDVLAARRGVRVQRLKFHSLYATDGDIVLLKPQTYMNRSGLAVRDAAAFYQIPPERVIVIQDDAALPTGRLRLRAGGSDGGHNGIKDILYHLQSDRFVRVKLGVGTQPHAEMELADWVLSDFSAAEQRLMAACLERAADAVESILTDGLNAAMNVYNARPKPDGDEGAQPDTP